MFLKFGVFFVSEIGDESLRIGDAMNEDRISELSSLSTETAVSMSVLSK